MFIILGYFNLHNNNSYYELVYTVNGPGPGPTLVDS